MKTRKGDQKNSPKSKKKQKDKRNVRQLSKRMQRHEALLFLSKYALASADFNAFASETVNVLARSIDVDYAKLLEADATSEYMMLKASYGIKEARPNVDKIRISSTLGGVALLSKRPIILTDVRNEKKSKLTRLFKKNKVTSGMSVVVPGIKKPYGAIGVYTKTKRVFSDDDLNFLQSVANLVALSVERANAKAELRRFQYMADNANVGISLVDKEGRFKYVNKVTYERLGMTKEEYMRRKVIYQDGDAGKPRFKKTFSLVQKENITPVRTYEYMKDGHNTVPLEISLTGVKFEGEPYMFVVSQDVTVRSKVQRNLVFLAKAGLVLSSSLSYDETLEALAKLSVDYFADWCVVDMIDVSGRPVAVTVAHRNPKKASLAQKVRNNSPGYPTASYRMLEISQTGKSEILRTGKSELYPEVTDDMLSAIAAGDTNKLKLLRTAGFRSALVVPIRANKKVIGTIMFATSETQRTYDEDDKQVAIQLADRASLALENARLYTEIEDQKTKLNNIIGNVPGVVWEMWEDQNHAEGRTNFVSDYVETMVGYTPEEWLEPGFWLTIVHPDDRERMKTEYDAMIREGSPIIQRFRWLHRDGRIIWVESHPSIILDARGKVAGTRGVFMDISERMELEKRKDEFISMASHELKTPVTTLKVFTQILQKVAERDGDQTRIQYLAKMDLQIQRLTDLINDLLDLSRIQTGKLSFKLSSFSLDELVHEVVEQIQPTIERHVIIVEGESKRLMTGDRDRMEQVIINLLTNAVKYSPDADKVVIRLATEDETVFLSVEDYGIGITKEEQKKIFDRFYQSAEDGIRTFPGLGIGLYISDQIVRRHGGKITVSSSKGKGSVFKVSIPLKPAKSMLVNFNKR